jgi:NAD-dependent SIR2 family protein deacetylase
MQQSPIEIPRLPALVEQAADERRLILFLGAGISCAAGLPSWDKVKRELMDQARLSYSGKTAMTSGKNRNPSFQSLHFGNGAMKDFGGAKRPTQR